MTPSGLSLESQFKLAEMIPQLEIAFARKIIAWDSDYCTVETNGVFDNYELVFRWLREQLFKGEGIDTSLDSHHVNADGVTNALYSRWSKYFRDYEFPSEEAKEKYDFQVARLKGLVSDSTD